MKNRILRGLGLRLALVMVPLASCWARQASPPPAVPDLAEAPAVPVSAERPAPANVRTDGPVGDLIKLANAGVDSSVLLAFATNSGSLFNLNAEEIIYLKDLGVPSAVVTAILQHDQALKGQLANSNPPLPPPPDWQYVPQPAAPADAAPAPAPQIAPPGYPPPEDYSPPPEDYSPPPDMADPGFYDALSPYGNWVQVDGPGLCWQPSAAVVDPSWQPYFDGGHWVYTDCGWYWASDYSWGWAPFHYGRWFHHHRWGWCWAPDTAWGPSWVCWRYTDGYCGWAPLPPGVLYRPGAGLTFHGRGVGADFGFGLGSDSFAFLSWAYFNERHLRPWAVRRDRIERIYRQSTAVTRFQGDVRTVSNAGLSAEHVAAASHTLVRPVAIHGVNAPVAGSLRAEHVDPNGKTLSVFRPSPFELSRPLAAIARRPETAAVRSLGATVSPATRSFGESRPVPLDPAGRNQALSNTRLSTAVRPAASPPRAQPAWLVPQTPQTQRQAVPAQRENPRSFYQAPAQREYQVQTYQAPAQVPRYSPPAERSRLDSEPPRAPSAPASAPARAERSSSPPAAGSGSQPSSARGGR